VDAQKLLQQKYQQLASSLGDVEFQIHVLSKKRDEICHQMQGLDSIVPDVKNLESFLKQQISSQLKESYEKARKGAQDAEAGELASTTSIAGHSGV
jgi:peptidoglycan hydrolase CwlO-like protein